VPEAYFNHEENLELNREIYGTQNALSIPMHIPLGIAVSEVVAETGIPTIAHHHDMWWERSRFLLNAVQDILQSAFPPDLPSIRHVVINSMIQRELAARRGLTSTMIYNVIDFEAPRHTVDEFNSDFRESFGFSDSDILILQPTRVVSRKGIEQGIPIHFLSNRLHDTRRYDETGRTLYTLWDVYPHADLITYPSLYEGFGNAFLEAVYFRKPLLVNRYSGYIVDIEPKGFETVAIDGFLTREAVDRVRDLLLDPARRELMTTRNFDIARRFFSYSMLEQRLLSLLQSFFGASPEVARGSGLLP
jgi:hypothetical protein